MSAARPIAARRPVALALAAIAATTLFSACSGTDAGLLIVRAPMQMPARRLEITLRNLAGGHVDRISAPAVEGSPIQFPTRVSFTFPGDLPGSIDLHVDAFDADVRVGAADGSAAIVHESVTAFDVTLQSAPPLGTVDGAAGD